MSRTIEMLFIVGVFVNVIKGADLLLRPNQQKWLQDKVDSLALRLDYTRPLEWYFNRQLLRKLYALLLGITLFGFCLSLALAIGEWQVWLIPLTALLPLTYVIRLTFTGKRIRFVDRLFGKRSRTPWSPDTSFFKTSQRLQDWLFAINSAPQSLIRPFLLFLLAIFWMGLDVGFCLVIIGLAITSVRIETTWVLILFCLISLVPIICYFVCLIVSIEPILMGIVCLLVLVFSLVLLFTEILLKLIRAVVWRIAEYNKGAFAAITLVTTVLLAIAEFYIKFGRH